MSLVAPVGPAASPIVPIPTPKSLPKLRSIVPSERYLTRYMFAAATETPSVMNEPSASSRIRDPYTSFRRLFC